MYNKYCYTKIIALKNKNFDVWTFCKSAPPPPGVKRRMYVHGAPIMPRPIAGANSTYINYPYLKNNNFHLLCEFL